MDLMPTGACFLLSWCLCTEEWGGCLWANGVYMALLGSAALLGEWLHLVSLWELHRPWALTGGIAQLGELLPCCQVVVVVR